MSGAKKCLTLGEIDSQNKSVCPERKCVHMLRLKKSYSFAFSVINNTLNPYSSRQLTRVDL